MTAPRRRWFRFSLRTLFVVVTVLAILLAQYPYFRYADLTDNAATEPPYGVWILTERFAAVALAEAIFGAALVRSCPLEMADNKEHPHTLTSNSRRPALTGLHTKITHYPLAGFFDRGTFDWP